LPLRQCRLPQREWGMICGVVSTMAQPFHCNRVSGDFAPLVGGTFEMNTSELALPVETRARSRMHIGAVAGLAALTVGIIANIAWDLSIFFTMLRMAFID
jgi:ABC-type sulfate transport system permease subunit